MTPVAAIELWAGLFVVSHLVISSAAVRPRLIAVLGEQPFRGLYSLVAFGTLGPLIYEFAYHKHAGPMLWFLRQYDAARWLTWLLMLLAFVFFVASFVSPSPALMGAPSTSSAHGIVKITRHPSFVAFALFGLAHMLMNGWLGDVIFFAMFPVLGVIGGVHQDQRKLRDLGESYRALMAETSFFPFAAIIAGRQKLSLGDLPWIGIAGGVAMTIMVIAIHPLVFGGNPFG